MRDELIERAQKLAAAGYSPIPVQGNNMPTEPKRPAISWRVFQQRIASEREIERSFGEEVTALGIVCGRVSGLLVIDFDDLLRYQQFCRRLPHYSATYTVKTKRGFHLYFRTNVKVASHQFDGGDIKAERSYVIAPPSRIGKFVYRCVNDVAERDLSKADVDALLKYFHVNAGCHRISGKRIREGGDLDLKGLYGRLAPRMGRNNALYRVSCLARDAGMEKAAAEREFVGLHVGAAASDGHRAETPEERCAEAMRTIASAFERGAGMESVSGGVPNSVRERLLAAQKSTVVARLLDCFALAGWEAESFFTLKEAISLGRRFGLSRKSVLQALTGDHSIFNGRHIISRRYVEYLDFGGLKGRKRGRPVELAFQAPSVGRLLSVLNVGRSPSDGMRSDDLRSAKTYRMAVHREYVRRLSPRSSLRALARRLGVNERTIRRYNAALAIELTACVGRLRLTRESVASLPRRGWRNRRNTTRGLWLEAGDGSRAPAWRHIGLRLLKAGDGQARICIRQWSVFSVKGGGRPAVQFEELSLRQFGRLLVLRGEAAGGGGLRQRVGRAVESLRSRAPSLRYEKIRLFFDSVDARIADDKVAETISGYLVAREASGEEVRRPARRGIAYRLLKQYGNGNVFLALRNGYKEVKASLGRESLRVVSGDEGGDGLALNLT